MNKSYKTQLIIVSSNWMKDTTIETKFDHNSRQLFKYWIKINSIDSRHHSQWSVGFQLKIISEETIDMNSVLFQSQN